MGIFGNSKLPHNLVPLHQDNIASKDWVILLEAGTIVGPSTEKLRIARTMLERKIVKKYSMWNGTKHFLVVDDFDPRIHALYFCPQLYKHDDEQKLVPLQGEEIGRLIANALERGIKERRPWYEPSEKMPTEPVITMPLLNDFDTLVVDTPRPRAKAA